MNYADQNKELLKKAINTLILEIVMESPKQSRKLAVAIEALEKIVAYEQRGIDGLTASEIAKQALKTIRGK